GESLKLSDGEGNDSAWGACRRPYGLIIPQSNINHGWHRFWMPHGRNSANGLASDAANLLWFRHLDRLRANLTSQDFSVNTVTPTSHNQQRFTIGDKQQAARDRTHLATQCGGSFCRGARRVRNFPYLG